MQYSETVVKAADGTELFARHCRTSRSDSAPTVLVVHGACEHGERYEHVVEALAELGCDSIVTDLRGHGRSQGVPMHVRRFDEYVSDLDCLQRHFNLTPERTVLLGHSMGGLISIRYCQRYPAAVQALVLISPLLRLAVHVPRLTVAVGRVLSHVAPRTRFRSRVDPRDTTRNLQAVAARLNDPQLRRSVTASWYFATQRALVEAWREAPALQLPVLLLQAGDDRIVCPQAPAEWVTRLSSTDASCQVLPDSLHELLNEPEWPETIEQISEWMKLRLDAGPLSPAGRCSA